MFTRRSYLIFTAAVICLIVLTSCSQSSTPPTQATPTITSVVITPTPSPTVTSTPDLTPVHFKIRTILSGVGRPDDLVFDPQGRLLFSDFYNGTVSRVNADGSVTVLLRGIAGP